MKQKILALLITGLFVLIPMTASAMTVTELDGTEFSVLILCLESIEGYCDKLTLTQDSFTFEDDFQIGSLDDTFFGYGSDGDYNDNGLNFSADLSVYEENLSRYTFDITGLNLQDQLIIGIMDIEYEEWEIIGWETEDTTKAYFVGFPR